MVIKAGKGSEPKRETNANQRVLSGKQSRNVRNEQIMTIR